MNKCQIAIEKVINKAIRRKSNGYILILIGKKWIPEHRLVVEEKIGRLLNSEEAVHHLDSNKKNNSIDNLMLFPSQREHKLFELKVKQFGYTRPIQKQIRERWDIYG